MSKVTEGGQQITLLQDVTAWIFWIGDDDFFFCEWDVEDGKAILDALEEVGDDEFIFTAVYEIDLHSDVDNLTGKKR